MFNVFKLSDFSRLSTHLVREICDNEDDAESEAGDVSPPLHVDLPTPCSGDMVPGRGLTPHLTHVALLFQTRDILKMGNFPHCPPVTRQDAGRQRSSMHGEIVRRIRRAASRRRLFSCSAGPLGMKTNVQMCNVVRSSSAIPKY